MALNAYGFDGEIPEQVWAHMGPMLGDEQTFGEASAGGSMAPSLASGDRMVGIAPGWAMSHGVAVNNTTATTVQCPAISSGTRWDTIVIRRDWQPASGGTATFAVVPGTASQALAGGMNRNPGVIEDQAIALAQVTATTGGAGRISSVEDLRLWTNKVISAGSVRAVQSPVNGQIVSFGGEPHRFNATTGQWLKIGATSFYQAAAAEVKGIVAATPTVATIKIPYPGYRYRVRLWARVVAEVPAYHRADYFARLDGDQVAYIPVEGPNNPPQQFAMPAWVSEPKTAASTATLTCRTFNPTTMKSGWTSTQWCQLMAEVIPV